MRYSVLAVLAAAGIASAQVSKIPLCALQCLEAAVGKSGCAVTDYYCQCTTGAAAIAKNSLPCLCKSTCTPAELEQLHDATNGICEPALSSSSMTYTATALTTNACALLTGSPSTATSAMSSATTSSTVNTGPIAATSGPASSTTGAMSSMSSAAASGSSSAAAASSSATSASPGAAPAVTVAAELLLGGFAAAAGYVAL